ncbi:AAA domain-containing protein [Sphingomonas hengshuiensis]|uniref:DNA helicase n=1 Tax=Sphingomonas hengshuiensis TaxID=1609977 RepID=A0A7U4JB97_9SPHN|nr:AAA domain-containing protein [Sphingomonas hengshuiensis]AJP73654.1 DNA helicase [Sphingomonas hengshuiensis]
MSEGRPVTLSQRVAEGGALPTEDLLRAMLPLMRAVAALHAIERVADLGGDAVTDSGDGVLALAHPDGRRPSYNDARLRAVQPHAGSALRVVGEYRVATDVDTGSTIEDLRARGEDAEAECKPAYLTGYRAWEQSIGHHDALADIFVIGLILASLACGLDLNDEEDVARFSGAQANLFRLNAALHPVIAALIVEMTALKRQERGSDLEALARRLEGYRDQPGGLDVERALVGATGAKGRRAAVLTHLRDRLFDLSRRNRLIHFRPTQASVNLTVASVPVVMRLESIRADQLCTWDSKFAAEVLGGGQIALAKWLRFEDQPYLPSAFDRIIQETRRDRAEYGFSHLRLVAAFLHWHNLKDAPGERIQSPLLWLPVEVTRKKGVRDQYLLRCPGTEAEFNPALRHYLRQLYDIQLPERVDLAQTSIEQIQADIAAQIHRSEPGVTLAVADKPQIELIHQKAVQRLKLFQRRKQRTSRASGVSRPEFSYERDDYRPLGLALFEKYVRPAPLPQRLAVGGRMPARPDRIVAGGDAEALTYALVRGEGHRYQWEIDLTQVTLANFNYKKMSLVRDYNQLIDDAVPPPAFDRIFSIEPRELEAEAPPALPLAEHHSVVPADATQDAAVAMARSGRSFIIQGPPGTGKSQTITNLIADYAARGKRVLFVCEKRAALDVVFNRLKSVGLDRLSCLIHDSQEDKKSFVMDLKDSYERWTRQDDGLDALWASRDRTLAALARHLDRIAAFDTATRRVPEATGASIRAMVRRRAALPETEALGPAVREQLPLLTEWDAHRGLAERIHRTMVESFGLASLAQHPFARLAPDMVASDRAYAEAEAAIGDGERLIDALDAALEDEAVLLSPDTRLADALTLVRAARQAVETNLAGNLALLDPGSALSSDFAAGRATLDRAQGDAEAAAEAAAHWRDPLTPEDTAAALEQARRQEPSFFKFLSGAWRRLKRTVRERYDFSAHAVEPSITTVLERLAARHATAAADAEARRAIARRFATGDTDALAAARDDWANATTPMLRTLIGHVRAAADPAALIAREAAPAVQIEALAALCARFLTSADDMTLGALSEALRDMREGLEELPDLLPLLAAADAAGSRMAYAMRSLALAPPAIEAQVIEEAFARILRDEPALQRFDAAELGSSARRAAKARRLLQRDNSAAILGVNHRRFRDHVKRSMLSVTQLDADGRNFKRIYSTGRRELEHEFGKSMRYRSIRDLSDDETGPVVIDLKPIWLMSPLSVSDTLPLHPELFDVVIFDEASQIPTEEAVPALSRAPQVIVVGDEMQLPPTSFFATARDEDEMQVSAEEDGETVAIILDADSLLNQSARSLPATLLAWHYRSRSEALISFSNAAFYEGRLITVPDLVLADPSAAPDPLRSDDAASAATAVDRMLARAVSFHPVADGLYEKRVNDPEARLIAAMVRDLLFRETGLSIGIVAFSEAQQTEIEDALETLAGEDKAFAARLEAEYAREDDGQINGLFIKNLENVQGDERDVILLSICYAPDANGRMAMNFGPINQRGGEKRLNVIFSRARHHMAVVSTIRAEAITNTHNDGARALRTFLAFAEAQSRGDAAHGQTVLATLNPEAQRVFARSAPTDALRDALAQALTARGHDVRAHIGSASFRCDLGILAPGGDRYQLGILIDGNGHGSVEDRYVFQPAILRAFGWKVIDVPSHSWLRDPDAVVAQIEAALRREAGEDDDDPFEGSTMAPPVVSVPKTKASDETPAPGPDEPSSALVFSEFRFQQASSDKFWKIAVSGGEMTVIFGRTGTKGSTVVKVFETPERAKREAAKLIAEKVRKGYLET